MKNEYHIGELANYFGVSRDTLRLYDEMGIVSPAKNESNGYRSYSRADLICLDYVMRLRQINLPLADIKMLMNDSTIERAEAVMQMQDKVLEDRIRELRHLQTMVRDYQKSFSDTIQSLGTICVKENPTLLYRDVENSMIDVMSDFNRLESPHVPKFTLVCSSEDIYADTFADRLQTAEDRMLLFRSAITMVDDEDLVHREPEKLKGYQILKPRNCVNATIKCYLNLDYSGFLQVKEYILANDLRLTGDMLVRFVSVKNNSAKCVDYYEIWAPIE